jgi:hypothetical protein
MISISSSDILPASARPISSRLFPDRFIPFEISLFSFGENWRDLSGVFSRQGVPLNQFRVGVGARPKTSFMSASQIAQDFFVVSISEPASILPGGFAVRLRMRLGNRANSFISPAFKVTCWMAKKERRQSRPEQVEEADKIYEMLILQRGLAGDLINASLRLISNEKEVADARFDLDMIVRSLGAAAPGSWNAIWKSYQHHFFGERNRQAFFSKLRSLTRRIASSALISVWETRRDPNHHIDADLRWDASLLPRGIAPSVLRLAILHPGVLEDFLPSFFTHASDCLLQKSTYRRALMILDAVPAFGWSAERHTKRLIELGEIKSSEAGSEVERVKKFIRDLRARHKKRAVLTAIRRPS